MSSLPLRTCSKCGYGTDSPLRRCPQCGALMQTTTKVLILGWTLVGIGGILTIGMGVITYKFAEMVSHTGEPGATSEYTGGPDMLLAIYGIFGLVMIFGVVSIVSGIWQIRCGRPNRKLLFVIFVLGFVFWLIGQLVRLR
jgi:hypothetical protein